MCTLMCVANVFFSTGIVLRVRQISLFSKSGMWSYELRDSNLLGLSSSCEMSCQVKRFQDTNCALLKLCVALHICTISEGVLVYVLTVVAAIPVQLLAPEMQKHTCTLILTARVWCQSTGSTLVCITDKCILFCGYILPDLH